MHRQVLGILWQTASPEQLVLRGLQMHINTQNKQIQPSQKAIQSQSKVILVTAVVTVNVAEKYSGKSSCVQWKVTNKHVIKFSLVHDQFNNVLIYGNTSSSKSL